MSTQSPHNFKLIYDFTVHVPKEIEREETVTEGDVTTIRKTKVTEPTPRFYGFKKPTRSENEDGKIEYASYWTHFIKKGVAPEAILLREYANWGGILNDYDREAYGAMRSEYVETDRLYQRAVALKEDAEALKHLSAMFTLKDKITTFEREQNSYFENTAEAMARNKYTQYCLLNYSYTRDAADKDWVPVFKGATFDEKYAALEALEEVKDEAFMKAGHELLFVASLYVAAGSSGSTLTKSDIETIKKQEGFAPVEPPAPVIPVTPEAPASAAPEATVT